MKTGKTSYWISDQVLVRIASEALEKGISAVTIKHRYFKDNYQDYIRWLHFYNELKEIQKGYKTLSTSLRLSLTQRQLDIMVNTITKSVVKLRVVGVENLSDKARDKVVELYNEFSKLWKVSKIDQDLVNKLNKQIADCDNFTAAAILNIL